MSNKSNFSPQITFLIAALVIGLCSMWRLSYEAIACGGACCLITAMLGIVLAAYHLKSKNIPQKTQGKQSLQTYQVLYLNIANRSICLNVLLVVTSIINVLG